LTVMIYASDVSLPVGFEIVAKTEHYIDPKDGKAKRRSPITKNERYQILVRQATRNQIKFRYVLNDIWFASAKNMLFVKHQIKRDFIMPLKRNRKVALTLTDKKQGRYMRLDTLELEAETTLTIYLEGVDFPLLLVKQIFINGDGIVFQKRFWNYATIAETCVGVVIASR